MYAERCAAVERARLRGGSNGVAAWFKLALLGLAFLAIGSIVLWLLYRWISHRLGLALKKPKLSAIMAGFFVCLSIPILIFILAYNYYRNSEVMMATLRDDVAKTRQASIENVEGMIQGVTGTLRLLEEVVGDDACILPTDRRREL